ncbi:MULTISPECIES: thioredoxin domain-containing protein [unclassified Streptomyces]|uniref:thioredoxin domain-containing protein n=1 Tax=unclassified Streptomyces TaxID=2593676 RepID=UPI000DC790A1|nr:MULTISPECIES: thioredoxin domain-containing protein [unclassified Streptomyces]AWZ09208.1 DsbA family protein [Streptomyces sp. ICC4]AWZ16932.1 DsbA family protein [Streptomyces sp. ICC1]
MATSNKKTQQREARERMRVEREALARRAKLRGRLLIGGALVAVLAVAVGIGVYVSKPSVDEEAAGKPFVQPANTAGKDGIVIPYGKADAKNVLSVWLDPRCPYCAGVEIGLGQTLKEQADAGTYRVDYHFATFLDKALGGGKGSKRAVNALGAAVNESPEKFMEYLQVLYKNHPEKESDDKFGSTATLLDLADQVPGLRTPAFNKAVKELTYMPWVEKVGQAFYDQNMQGTPDVSINGKKLTVNSGQGIDSITPDAFKKLIADNLKK